jgi:hypothetical protein
VDFLKLLPLAFVMIAGPQILSAVFLATSENWRANSAAYVAGAACSITIFVTAAFFLIHGTRSGGGPSDGVYIAILVLLAFAMVHAFLKREESEPPKWMGRLQSANPRFSFTLGFLLLGIFPTDIATSVAVGAYLGNRGDGWFQVLPFIGLTLLFLATPALLLLVLGSRAEAFMPKARDWMNNNSWVVNEIVLALFFVLTLDNLV